MTLQLPAFLEHAHIDTAGSMGETSSKMKWPLAMLKNTVGYTSNAGTPQNCRANGVCGESNSQTAPQMICLTGWILALPGALPMTSSARPTVTGWLMGNK